MVIALEPGVYGPDETGARVENLFIVTPGGGVELREAFGVTPEARYAEIASPML